MKNKYDSTEPENERSIHGRQVYDPLTTASNQSDAFNRAWLKNGESLLPIQRFGYVIFSLAFVGIGLFFGVVCWGNFRSSDPMSVLWGVGTLFFLFLGGLGLRNAMKFRRGKQ
jgi:hypothetical protein